MSNIDRAQLIEGLRGIADFLEAHPDYPLHSFSTELRSYAWSPEEASVGVHALLQGASKITKDFNESYPYLHLKRQFGPLTLNLGVDKDDLGCHKVKKIVQQEVEEWACGPLLELAAIVEAE